MRIGIYLPPDLPKSMSVYAQQIMDDLRREAVAFIEINTNQDLMSQQVDVYWDPGRGAGAPPVNIFRNIKKPAVATLHGAGRFSLTLGELHQSPTQALYLKASTYWYRFRWRDYLGSNWRFVTVSNYARSELERHLPIRDRPITSIYHGIDHSVFQASIQKEVNTKPFFFHVSQYRPKKNLERIIAAYTKLNIADRVELKIIAPNAPSMEPVEGVTLVRRTHTHQELADYYQNALAFVFPSLHETFGMPIIEAMACGCPVITSNITACPEVAGRAALLVNPHSVDEIANAMQRLIDEPEFRAELRQKGLQRASQFSWERCAQEHLQVFRQAVEQTYEE